MEGFIGRNSQFMAGQMARDKGRRASGNENIFGGYFPARCETNRVAVESFGALHDELGACSFEISDIGLVEPVDFLVLVLDQGCPVEAHFLAGPAKADS